MRIPSDPQLSPDGQKIAFTLTTTDRTDDADHHSIWVISADGKGLRRLTRGSNDRAPRWSPDGSHLAFLSKRDGTDQIFLLPIDGGEAHQLTALPLGVDEPVWSPDGSGVAFTAMVDIEYPEVDFEKAPTRPLVVRKLDHKADGIGRVARMRRHVFVTDLHAAQPTQLTSGDFFTSTPPVWSPDSSEIAFAAGISEDRDVSFRSVVHIISARGGRPRPITPEDATLAPVGWSPNGKTLLVAGQECPKVGHRRLFVVGTNGAPPQPVAPALDRNVMLGAPGYPGALPRFIDTGQQVLFCIRDRGRVHIVSVADGEHPTVVVGGDLVVAGMSEIHGRIAFVAASLDSPGELYVVNKEANMRRLTYFFREALPDVEVVEPIERSFIAADGTKVEGWVLRREPTGASPLLLDVHGGPHNAWGPALDPAHIYQQTLAARGWTILCINPRGSDGYGERFWTALGRDKGYPHPDEQDFIAAVDALVKDGTADPERIAVAGYSYGGEMTCWLTAKTDKFAAAVAGGCVSDMVSFTGTSDLGWYTRAIAYGRPSYADPALMELSPITHVSSVTTPTLLLHGIDDHRCPVGQAEQWFTALRAHGVLTELVLYPEASHLFILSGKPSHRLDYCKRLEEWVIRHVEEGH